MSSDPHEEWHRTQAIEANNSTWEWLGLPAAERTGNLTAVTLVLAGFSVVTLGCALFFPDRREELAPELWAAVPVAAE